MRESWYYPAGTNLNDPWLTGGKPVYCSCDACGGDIYCGDVFYNFKMARYCEECCTEISPEVGDICEECGDDKESRMFEIDGKKYCAKCVEIERAEY